MEATSNSQFWVRVNRTCKILLKIVNFFDNVWKPLQIHSFGLELIVHIRYYSQLPVVLLSDNPVFQRLLFSDQSNTVTTFFDCLAIHPSVVFNNQQ